MVIVIVEDDVKMREELSRLLTSNGYKTILIDNFKDI